MSDARYPSNKLSIQEPVSPVTDNQQVSTGRVKSVTMALPATVSIVVSALSSINVVNRHRARFVLGWVTVCGQLNHLGM